jgi:polycystin 1L2
LILFLFNHYLFRSLGKLSYLRIWHDNTGIGDYASWFLGVVIVRDIQTGEKYQFINDQWLAVEKDDGQVLNVVVTLNVNSIILD